MIPMGFGMAAVNSGVLFLSASQIGTIFLDPMATNTHELMNILQIDWLQPVYTFMFSNGLIACLVFMGIGVISDVGSVLKYPFTGMMIAMFAELGTVATFPIARAVGFTYGEAAAISLIGVPMAPWSSCITGPCPGPLRSYYDCCLLVPEPDLRRLSFPGKIDDSKGFKSYSN